MNTITALPGDRAPYAYVSGGVCKWSLSRWVYGAGAVFTAVACAGSFFGWSNMVPILQSEGYFQDQCADGLSGCSAQSLAFNSIYNAASICSFISPLFAGMLSDRFGPRAAMRLVASVFTLGAVALIVAATTNTVGLLYMGFICFGISASSMLLPIYNYANMFPGYEGLALGILNGSFDAGSLVYFVMGRLYDSGVSLSTLMIAYLCGPILILLLNAGFLWRPIPFFPLSTSTPKVVPSSGAVLVRASSEDSHTGSSHPDVVAVSMPTELSGAASIDENPVASASVTSPTDCVGRDGGVLAGIVHMDTNSATRPVTPLANGSTHPGLNVTPPSHPVVAEDQAAIKSELHTPLALSVVVKEAGEGELPSKIAPPMPEEALPVAIAPTATVAAAHAPVDLHSLPVLRQLLTPDWLMYAGFFVVNMLRYNVYIGSVDTQLTSTGQVDSEYTKIFGIIAPLGFFVQFIAGPILDRWGLATSLSVQWCLVVLLSALNLIPSLEAQVATFCAFAAFRAFHFVNMTAYMARTFGYRTLGITIGSVILLGGLFSLLQTVFLLWAFNVPGATEDIGDFTAPNSLLLALSVAVGYFPVWYVWRSRRRASHTAKQADAGS